MEEKKLISEEDFRKIVKDNLNKIYEARNYTLSEFGMLLGGKPKATVHGFLDFSTTNIPSAYSMHLLAEHFGIPEEMLYSRSFNPATSFELDYVGMSEYDKFVGVYSLYYLSTSKIGSYSNKYAEEAELSYGVMAIVKDATAYRTKEAYKAYASFSIKSEAEANALKLAAEKALNDNDKIGLANVFLERDRYCEGDFELIQKTNFFSISMTGYSKTLVQKEKTSKVYKIVNDKILLMGFNPDNTEPLSYLGGALHSSSLSRGDRKTPCSQLIVALRPTTSNVAGAMRGLLFDIHEQPYNQAPTADIMKRVRELRERDYPVEDADTLLESTINQQFKLYDEKASSQIFHLFGEQDKLVYQHLKRHSESDKSYSE